MQWLSDSPPHLFRAPQSTGEARPGVRVGQPSLARSLDLLPPGKCCPAARIPNKKVSPPDGVFKEEPKSR